MQIKICGITSIDEIQYLNEVRPDYAGMVLFFEKSKRNITIAHAGLLMQSLDPAIKRVAVVVSPNSSQIQAIEAAGFDYIQIHGIMNQDALAGTSIPVLRAFNVSDLEELDTCQTDKRIAGYVFDALQPGSGEVFDWNILPKLPDDGHICLLAGGLTPENVRSAMITVHPSGVDVSSGVEYINRPGKDPDRIRAFVEAVRGCHMTG